MGAGVAREVIALAGDRGAEGVDVVRDRVVAAAREHRAAGTCGQLSPDETFRLGNQRALIDFKFEKEKEPLCASFP